MRDTNRARTLAVKFNVIVRSNNKTHESQNGFHCHSDMTKKDWISDLIRVNGRRPYSSVYLDWINMPSGYVKTSWNVNLKPDDFINNLVSKWTN